MKVYVTYGGSNSGENGGESRRVGVYLTQKRAERGKRGIASWGSDGYVREEQVALIEGCWRFLGPKVNGLWKDTPPQEDK